MIEKNKRGYIAVGIMLLGVIWVFLLIAFPFWDLVIELIRITLLTGTILSPFFGITCFMFFLPLIPDEYVSFQLGSGIPDLTWQRLFILILVLSVLMHVTISKKLRERTTLLLSRFDIIILLYGLVMFVSVFLAKDTQNSLEKYIVIIFIPLTIYFLCRMYIVKWHRVNILLTVIMVSSTLIALVMIYQGVTKTNYFYNLWYPKRIFDFAPPIESIEGIYQAPGIIGNQNVNGIILVTSWAIGIFLLRHGRNMFVKFFCLSYFAVSLPAIFYSYSRKTWIGLLIVLLASFWAKKRRKYLIPFTLFCAGIISFHYLFLSQEIVEERIMSPSTLLKRVDLVKAGWEMFLDSPVFGHGFGEYRNLSVQFGSDIPGLKAKEWISHNSYIAKLAENGIVGFVFFMLAVLFPFYRIRRSAWEKRVEDKPTRDYNLAFWGIGIFYLGAALGANIFENLWLSTYFFCFVAIALNISRFTDDEISVPSSGRLSGDDRRKRMIRQRPKILPNE